MDFDVFFTRLSELRNIIRSDARYVCPPLNQKSNTMRVSKPKVRSDTAAARFKRFITEKMKKMDKFHCMDALEKFLASEKYKSNKINAENNSLRKFLFGFLLNRQLKAILSDMDLPVGGTKKALVQRLVENTDRDVLEKRERIKKENDAWIKREREKILGHD